uniref:Uncharacterized protein n=1 Tax=Electrophorus electricus TaxID=8005 RepID=A0A4W4FJ78_ELEEL
VVPLAVVDLLVDRPRLGGARAHVQQQIQVSVQHLDGEEVHLQCEGALGLLGLLLGPPVAEEQQAIGLRGAEVEGDGARLLGVPLVQGNEGLRGLKRDGVKSGHVLTLEGHHTMDLHLVVALQSQPGELQSHVVVFVYHLSNDRPGVNRKGGH